MCETHVHTSGRSGPTYTTMIHLVLQYNNTRANLHAIAVILF